MLVTIIVVIAVLGVIAFFALRNKDKEDVVVEEQPVIESQPVPVEVKPVATTVKRRVKSAKGLRLNRNRRSFSEIDSDLFEMTFPGIYHPHRALYFHDWYLDNFIEDEDDYEIELEYEDFGFNDVVTANVYQEGDMTVVALLNANGDVVDIVHVSEEYNLIIGNVEYLIDEDSGVVSITDGENLATYSDQIGYSVNTGSVEEANHFETSEEHEQEVLEAEAEDAVAAAVVLNEAVEEVVEIATEEVVETLPETTEEVVEATDISDSADTSADDTAY